jgi:hypothetical protein
MDQPEPPTRPEYGEVPDRSDVQSTMDAACLPPYHRS